jgi:hypothetical protein
LFEKNIENKNLRELGRAADMLWLSIGEPIMIDDYKGGTREVSEYAIHFQCQWRFVKNGKILLASHDIYNPYNKELEYDDEWDWSIFGREKEKSSLFDVHSAELNRLLPFKIMSIKYNDTSDLHIDFQNGIYFDTFISCSRKREYYRFIDFTSEESKHVVIFDVD